MTLNIEQDGNQLFTVGSTVVLKLVGKPTRNLGVYKEGIFSVKRQRAKHLFRRMNGYGFCDLLIKNLPNTTTVQIKDETGQYNVPVAVISQEGNYDIYTPESFEKQIFLDIDTMSRYKFNRPD